MCNPVSENFFSQLNCLEFIHYSNNVILYEKLSNTEFFQ